MDEENLDIREYANVLLARWWLLALGPLVAVLVVLGISLSAPASAPISPEYLATTSVLMGGSGDLAQYPDLVTSGPVLGKTITDLALSIPVTDLRSKLSASRVDDQMVRIQAADSDPATAVRLADGVAQSYIDYLASVKEPQLAAAQERLALSLSAFGTGNSAEAAEKAVEAVEEAVAGLTYSATPAIIITPAEVLQEPILGSAPPSHSLRNTALASILGVFLAVLVIFLLEYLQRPVRSPAQMERRFGLNNLGSVPRWRRGRGAAS